MSLASSGQEHTPGGKRSAKVLGQQFMRCDPRLELSKWREERRGKGQQRGGGRRWAGHAGFSGTVKAVAPTLSDTGA